MARSQQPTQSDLATLRHANDALGSKVAHDMRELRERIDRAPALAQQQLEALTLDLNGARSEIAAARTLTIKVREEAVANVAAVRGDIVRLGETVEAAAKDTKESFAQNFEKFDERLAHGLTRVASQVSDSEATLGDSLLNLRSQAAALRGDIGNNHEAVLDRLDTELPNHMATMRAEMRSESSTMAQALRTQLIVQEDMAKRSHLEVKARIDNLERIVTEIFAWQRRPRWWQWRYWFSGKTPAVAAPAPEEERPDSIT